MDNNQIQSLPGLQINSPWQAAYQDPEMLRKIYEQQQAQSPNAIQAANYSQNTPVTMPTAQVHQETQNTFGAPNWEYIFGSQMIQNLMSGISNHSANSRENATKNFNKDKFNPLSYLPENPNTSKQDLFGMKEGGIHIKKSHEGRFTEYKKRTGKTTEEALHSKDPHVRKMAQFAKNASKWKHQLGGMFAEGGEFSDADYDFLFGDETAAPEVAPEKSRTQTRKERELMEDQLQQQKEQESDNYLNALWNNDTTNDLTPPDFTTIPFNPNSLGIKPLQKGAEYRDYLQSKGLSPEAASGAVANFYAESSLNPAAKNSIGAFGLGQWLGDRKKGLETFAKTQGKSVTDPYVQMDYLMHELKTSESGTASGLEGLSSPAQAALHFMNKYERPSASDKAQSASKRIAFANQLGKYEQGGEYDITPTEMKRLRALGYDFDIL